MNIEHLALNVPDPTAMADWYEQHLSMRVIRSLAEAPFTHFLADVSGKVVLELYHHTKAAIPDYAAMHPLVLHIAFVAGNVRKERDRLIAAGARAAEEITVTPNGDEMTFLHDPWGVCIQLVRRKSPLL